MKNTILSRIFNKIKSLTINRYSLENIFFYILAKKSYKRYQYIEFSKIREYIKKSDTVVIFGTGSSILDITDKQWKELSKYNSISIGSFAQFNKYIDIDINHFREIGSYNFIYQNSRVANWEEMLNYTKNINNNPLFDNTIHLFQDGIVANASNRFIYSELLEFNNRYSIYKSKTLHKNKLCDKFGVLSHLSGSLGEAINIAYQLKWKKIILAGIDLYDRQYFYKVKGQTVIWDLCRDTTVEDKHNMANNTINNIKVIDEQLKKQVSKLYILNHRSLLSEYLPLYKFKQ